MKIDGRKNMQQEVGENLLDRRERINSPNKSHKKSANYMDTGR